MNIRDVWSAPASHSLRAVVGFDGFVDEIIHVIGRRLGPRQVDRITRIADFGAMISAAAGRSLGREIQIVKTEGGGNGPNLADGLLAFGVGVDLFGTLGEPRHPAFDDVARRCRSCTAVGSGYGRTLAFEFGDGKLMLNETSDLASLDAAAMQRVIDAGVFRAACAASQIIGLVNWSKYPGMTDCWRLLQERVLASLTHRPWLLIDLADPAGREPADLRDILELLGAMQRHCRVVLGVNLHEAGVIVAAYGESKPTDDSSAMRRAASLIQSRLGIEYAVIHSQRRAAGASASESACVDGEHTDSPLRTTGVGDRFNAGLIVSLASGQSLAVSLAAGCAAGGYFVRHGKPGSVSEIRDWLQSLPGQ